MASRPRLQTSSPASLLITLPNGNVSQRLDRSRITAPAHDLLRLTHHLRKSASILLRDFSDRARENGRRKGHIETTIHFNMDKTRFHLLDSFQIKAILKLPSNRLSCHVARNRMCSLRRSHSRSWLGPHEGRSSRAISPNAVAGDTPDQQMRGWRPEVALFQQVQSSFNCQDRPEFQRLIPSRSFFANPSAR